MVMVTKPEYLFQPAQNFTFAARKDSSMSLADLQRIQLRSQFAGVISTVAEFTKHTFGPKQFTMDSTKAVSSDSLTIRDTKTGISVLTLNTQSDSDGMGLHIKDGTSPSTQIAYLGLKETALSGEKINEIFEVAGGILSRAALGNPTPSSKAATHGF